MKPLIGKRIGATKSFRRLVVLGSVSELKLASVFLSATKLCKRTLQPVRRLSMGTVALGGLKIF